MEAEYLELQGEENQSTTKSEGNTTLSAAVAPGNRHSHPVLAPLLFPRLISQLKCTITLQEEQESVTKMCPPLTCCCLFCY